MTRWLVAVAMLVASGCGSVESAAPHAPYDAAALDTAAEGASDAADAPADTADSLVVEAAPDAADSPEATPDAAPDADAAEAPPTQEEMCKAHGSSFPPPFTEWTVATCVTHDGPDVFKCEFVVASDGLVRCLPPIARVVGWPNAACGPATVGVTDAPSFYKMVTLVEAGVNVVRTATKVSPPEDWYRMDAAGACVLATDPWPDGAFSTTQIVQPSAFVAYP